MGRMRRLRGSLNDYKRRVLRHTPLGRRHLFIVRRADGRVWKGPYKHGWTRKPKEYYLFGSEQWAHHALQVTGETGTVVQVI